jgi:hypothetical protein
MVPPPSTAACARGGAPAADARGAADAVGPPRLRSRLGILVVRGAVGLVVEAGDLVLVERRASCQIGSVPCWSPCSACSMRSLSATSKPSASPSPASISGANAGSTGSSGFSGHFAMTQRLPPSPIRTSACDAEGGDARAPPAPPPGAVIARDSRPDRDRGGALDGNQLGEESGMHGAEPAPARLQRACGRVARGAVPPQSANRRFVVGCKAIN